MATVLYVNSERRITYIGGVAIPPGEARDVDAALIPAQPSIAGVEDSPADGAPPVGGSFSPAAAKARPTKR